MHFKILVEDQSGKETLEILVPKILDLNQNHTYIIHPYLGGGHIPEKLKSKTKPKDRILLDQLPRILEGIGKECKKSCAQIAVVVIVDLDDKCLKSFRTELFRILENCNPRPTTCFCIAIEEGEAWLLGDLNAIKKAYNHAKNSVLDHYKNDDICGTWECLADAVYKGGASQLKKMGWQAVGREKSTWAKNISPHMDIENNRSPSFNYFVKKIRDLATNTNCPF
ncbi:MAG: DUF4276 family protein [Magnetococcus sp. DMHC-1]